MTLLDLYTKASFSFRFEVDDGWCSFNRKVGQAMVMLGDGIKDLDPAQQYRRKKAFPADGSDPPDDIKNPLSKGRAGKAAAFRWFTHLRHRASRNQSTAFTGLQGADGLQGVARFEKVVDFHETTGGGEGNQGERLTVSGRIYISPYSNVCPDALWHDRGRCGVQRRCSTWESPSHLLLIMGKPLTCKCFSGYRSFDQNKGRGRTGRQSPSDKFFFRECQWEKFGVYKEKKIKSMILNATLSFFSPFFL